MPPTSPRPLSRFSAVPPAGMPDDYIVDPFPVVADDCGLSLATFKREIKAGRGPKITQLSARRFGVQRRHRREWLDARTTNVAA
jgi:hypothetical protein